jgi:hypothetical protein
MIIQHLFPVFALIALGAALKRFGLTNSAFLSVTDRLIYFIFFPILLFWKIGASAQTFTPEAARFYLSVIGTVICIYILSTLFILLFKISAFQAGTFSQSCYRFNSYVGMAVILSVLGESGVARFGILIGLVIPLINVLSVTTLIWFSATRGNVGQRLKTTLLSILCGGIALCRLAKSISSFYRKHISLRRFDHPAAGAALHRRQFNASNPQTPPWPIHRRGHIQVGAITGDGICHHAPCRGDRQLPYRGHALFRIAHFNGHLCALGPAAKRH